MGNRGKAAGWAAVMITVAVAAACSSGGRGTEGSSALAGGTGGSAADAGGAPGGSGAVAGNSCTDAPPVPDAWVRPADCNGVGNLCSEGCAGAACQLIGDVCIPFSRAGSSATPCTPYCMAFVCMNFDEASCFCTGSAAAQNPACACGPKAVAGVCAADGVSCATTPCCDCDGLACVTDSVSGTVCRQPCKADADCRTGCCNTTTGRCQDALYCNCAKAGADCGSSVKCCPGSSCLTFSSDTTNGPFSCYPDCKTQSDCPNGTCCSQTISGLDHGGCGPCK